MLLVPCEIIFVSIRLEMSPWKSFNVVLMKRFDDSPVHDGAKGVATGSPLRWILFILGTLPQAIRLASFRGVAFTKFLGYSFVAEIFFVELLIAMRGHRSSELSDALRTESQKPEYKKTFSQVEWISYKVLLASFAFLTSGINKDLYLRGYGIVSNPEEDSLAAGLLFQLMIAVYYISALPLSWSISWALAAWKNPRNPEREGMVTESVDGWDLMMASLFEIIRVHVEDKRMIYYWFTSLFNFAICLLAYCILYDSEGTQNPGWTAVFG